MGAYMILIDKDMELGDTAVNHWRTKYKSCATVKSSLTHYKLTCNQQLEERTSERYMWLCGNVIQNDAFYLNNEMMSEYH